MQHNPCERSCTKCLRHYGNRFWHNRLDRHLAAQLLLYARDNSLPMSLALSEQALFLAPFQRFLELEGYQCIPNAIVGFEHVPLLVTKPAGSFANGHQSIALGIHPALLDPVLSRSMSLFQEETGRSGIKSALLNEYIVARDLPTAYQQFLKEVE